MLRTSTRWRRRLLQGRKDNEERAVTPLEKELQRQAAANPYGASALLLSQRRAEALYADDELPSPRDIALRPRAVAELRRQALGDLFGRATRGRQGGLRRPGDQAGVFAQAAARRRAFEEQVIDENFLLRQNKAARGRLAGFTGGEPVPGPTDTVPAPLTPGELVVKRDAAQAHLPLLQAINRGYAQGGVVRGGTQRALAVTIAG